MADAAIEDLDLDILRTWSAAFESQRRHPGRRALAAYALAPNVGGFCVDGVVC